MVVNMCPGSGMVPASTKHRNTWTLLKNKLSQAIRTPVKKVENIFQKLVKITSRGRKWSQQPQTIEIPRLYCRKNRFSITNIFCKKSIFSICLLQLTYHKISSLRWGAGEIIRFMCYTHIKLLIRGCLYLYPYHWSLWMINSDWIWSIGFQQAFPGS